MSQHATQGPSPLDDKHAAEMTTTSMPSQSNRQTLTYDTALARLTESKQRWASLPIESKLGFLDDVRVLMREYKREWVEAGLRHKNLSIDDPRSAEEWLNGPYACMRNVRLLMESLKSIAQSGGPRFPSKPHTGEWNQVVVPIFPASYLDSLLFMGYKAEVWMQPEVTLESLAQNTARIHRQFESGATSNVSLVLGAGNVSSIPVMDVLEKLFVNGNVVLLKMHPLNQQLGPVFEKIFGTLIEDGYVQIVNGDRAEGEYLCTHPQVDDVHITGSAFSAQAIAKNIREKTGRDKPLTSELGNITPVIVIPGKWAEKDLRNQALNVASMLTNNAGCNCVSARMVITHRAWPQRELFLGYVEQALGDTPPREAYYPGTFERYEKFRSAHRDARELVEGGKTILGKGELPWLFIRNLDPNAKDDISYREEPFGPIMSEVSLEASSRTQFIERAVEFSNNTLWGSLAACIIVPDRQLAKDPEGYQAYRRAIRDLEFGTIGINVWPGLGFALGSAPWLAHPKNPDSGIGVVHNTFMFEKPEKTVVQATFRLWPKPAWYSNHATAARIGPRLVDFESDPSAFKIPAIAFAASRG